MSPADRAKQFMPFDAVKGLREALAKKEAELLMKKDEKGKDEEWFSENATDFP